MKCRDIIRMLAAGRELNAATREHVASCDRCRAMLRAAAFEAGNPALPEQTLERFTRTLTADLSPVSPVRPARHVFLFVAFAVLAVAAGVVMFGARGWRLATPLQESWIWPALLLLAGVLPAALARLMIPGSLIRVRLSGLLVIMVCWFALAAPVVYPARMYPGFAKAAIACLFIALSFGAVVACASWVTLHRGFVTSPRLAALAAGALGGTTSLALQVIYCPHLDTGHFAIAHFGSFFLATLLGALLLYRIRRQ